MGKQSREKRERLVRRSPEGEGGSPGEGGSEERGLAFQSGLEKTCLFLIRWGTYLVLFTPLVINLKFFFPFVAPKTIFFRIIIEIILVAYIFLVITNRHWRPRINALTVAVTLFLIVFILASLTGVNLSRSFWSTYERMTGILTMLHLFAFFIILSSVFRRREDWEKFLSVSITVGVFLSLYILLGQGASSRGGGTIGNTSFMAAYLLFDIFFAIILFLSNLFKKDGWSLFWQFFSGASLLIMLPVLFASTARGATTSFYGGLFLLFLGYLIFSQKKTLKRLAAAIILLSVMLTFILAVFQPSLVKKEVRATLKEMKSRLVVWETGWHGFLERPILGWGPENFNNVFLKYYNPCMSLPACGTEVWFDRVHNVIFDTLVTTGIVGLLSYLSVFGIAIYGLFKTLPKLVERKNIFIPLGLITILIVYFFQNLLVFDMINTYLVFFLTLALINFLTQERTEEKEARKRLNALLAFSIIAVMTFILWAANIQPLRANSYIIKMVGSQDPAEASLFFQKSLDTWMEKYETREYFTQKIYKSVYQEIPKENREAFQKAFDLTESEMEKSIKQNYLDFRPHLFLGELYISSYRFSGNSEKLVGAEQVLEKAIQLSPTNQQGYWNLAEAKIAQGKIDETISLLKKAITLEPKVGYSHLYLATAYRIAGQNELAQKEIIEAEKVGFNLGGDLESLKKAIDIYLALNDNAGLVPLYLKAIESAPNDAQLWAALAVSYANLGQFEKAKEAARRVAEINPDLQLKIEEFLKKLP